MLQPTKNTRAYKPGNARGRAPEPPQGRRQALPNQLSPTSRRSKSLHVSNPSTSSPPSSAATRVPISTPRGSQGTSRATSSTREGHSNEEGGFRVAVRVRPLTTEEEAKGGERVLRCRNPKVLELLLTPAVNGSESRFYNFDLCAHEGFSQEEMFSSCGLMPLLVAAIDGYACTVFAYGATGAGKTYTMSGREQISRVQEIRTSRAKNTPDESDGLIQRSMRYIFDRVSSLPEDVKLRIRASYCEIYNEVVFDLLNRQDRPLQVRYNSKRGFFVQGLFEVEIRGLEDIMAVVDEGNGNRRVAAHAINQDSSRSHSLLTVYLQSEQSSEEDIHSIQKFGKVAFVDLAGSERLKRSHTKDGKETASINRSLMTLGKVISALSKQGSAAATRSATSTVTQTGEEARARRRSVQGSGAGARRGNAHLPAPASTDVWVPYRDSTLTKLLMESLGGNRLTLMVACVSPSADHAEESAATLNYAARALNIRNKPHVQLDPREKLIAALRCEVGLLRMENSFLRGGSIPSSTPGGRGSGHGSGKGSRITPLSGNDSEPWQQSETPKPLHSPPHSKEYNAQAGEWGGNKGKTAALDGAVGVMTKGTEQELSLLSEAQSLRMVKVDHEAALLLEKYEEECHHLRRESARASHKEHETERMTQQVLQENEELSRTVDRLQKTFVTKDPASGQGQSPPKRPGKNATQGPASNEGRDANSLPTATCPLDSRSGVGNRRKGNGYLTKGKGGHGTILDGLDAQVLESGTDPSDIGKTSVRNGDTMSHAVAGSSAKEEEGGAGVTGKIKQLRMVGEKLMGQVEGMNRIKTEQHHLPEEEELETGELKTHAHHDTPVGMKGAEAGEARGKVDVSLSAPQTKNMQEQQLGKAAISVVADHYLVKSTEGGGLANGNPLGGNVLGDASVVLEGEEMLRTGGDIGGTHNRGQYSFVNNNHRSKSISSTLSSVEHRKEIPIPVGDNGRESGVGREEEVKDGMGTIEAEKRGANEALFEQHSSDSGLANPGPDQGKGAVLKRQFDAIIRKRFGARDA